MAEHLPEQPTDGDPTEPKLDAKRCVLEYSAYSPEPSARFKPDYYDKAQKLTSAADIAEW